MKTLPLCHSSDSVSEGSEGVKDISLHSSPLQLPYLPGLHPRAACPFITKQPRSAYTQWGHSKPVSLRTSRLMGKQLPGRYGRALSLTFTRGESNAMVFFPARGFPSTSHPSKDNHSVRIDVCERLAITRGVGKERKAISLTGRLKTADKIQRC